MANRPGSPVAVLARSASAVVCTLLACNSVFGIEDAHVDPTLSIDGQTSGGTGGASNQTSGGATASSGGNAGKSATEGGNVGAVGQGGNDAIGVAGGGAANGGEPGTGEAGAGGAPPPASLCEGYCDTITQLCIGTSLQYKDRAQCLAVCELFPQGAVGDPDGNTIACRSKYAEKARYAGGTELNAYCRQAGPGGAGRCGTNCDGLCTISMATCTKKDTEPYYFDSDAACHSACQNLPEVPFAYGDVSVADGNSVGCRLFHGISAAMMDPEEHCAHVLGITLCEE